MATKMNDEFMFSVVNEEAWKELSGDFKWSEALLEKYQNDVDWDEISQNRDIQWTIPMAKKFCKRINWTRFSGCVDEETLSPQFIEIFKDYLDWNELSDNYHFELTVDFLTRYADLLNWENIINKSWRGGMGIGSNDCEFEGGAVEFYEKFREYIPASKLQGSSLWRAIVEQRKKQLINEIIS